MFKRWMFQIITIVFIVSNISLCASPAISYAEDNPFEYVGQDSLFFINDTPDTLIGVADPTASDGMTAKKVLKAINTWDFQLRMTNGIFTNDANGNATGVSPFVPGKAYELYARVKVDFNDEDAPGYAFSVGVYSITQSNFPLPGIRQPLSQLNANEWTDIKIGTYIPALNGKEAIYLAAANHMNHIITAVYVDKFYYKEAPAGVPAINLGGDFQNSPVSHAGGTLSIPVTTVNIANGGLLDVKVTNSNGELQNFEVQSNTIQGNNATIKIIVPQRTKGGIYHVEASYQNAGISRATFEITNAPLIMIGNMQGTPVSYNGGTLNVSAATLNIEDSETIAAQVYDANGNDVTGASGITFTGNTVSGDAVEMAVQIPPFTAAGTYTLQLAYGNTTHQGTFVVDQAPIITIGAVSGDPIASSLGGELVIPVTTQNIADQENVVVIVRNENDQVENFSISGTTVVSGQANIRVTIPPATTDGNYTAELKYATIPSSTITFTVTGVPYLKAGEVTNSPVSYKGGEIQLPVSSANIADGSEIAVTIKDDAGADVTETLSFAATGNTIMANAAHVVITVPNGTPEGVYAVELESPGAAISESSFAVQGAPLADILPIIDNPVSYSGGSLIIPITTMNIGDNEDLSITVKDGMGADQTSLFAITGNKVAANQASIQVIVPETNATQDAIYTVQIHYDSSLLGSTQFRVLARPESVTGDYLIEDNSFIYRNNAASEVDGTASDGFSATMAGSSASKDIVYKAWDFSMLKYAAPYDVYFKLKVDPGTSVGGGVVKVGVYDATQKKELIPPRVIDVSEITDQQWKEFRVGTINPNYGVNRLDFYVEGMGNDGISGVYVDHIVLKEAAPHVIQNGQFTLGSNASNIPDGLTPDNSATRVVNGANEEIPAIEIPIAGSDLVAGDYTLMLLVNPDRVPGSNWDDATGDVMGLSVHDVTTGQALLPKKIYTTANSPFNMKLEYFGAITMPIGIDPSHEYLVKIYSTANEAKFPSFRVDSLTLTRVLPEIYYDPNKYNNVYPYKISPANQDGINDRATIYYSIHGLYEPGKTIDVKVYDEQGNTIKRLVEAREDWTYVKETWDGTNDQGITVANGLYTIEVKRSDNRIFLRRNVQVISGVQLTEASVNPALDDFPKGVWFEAGNIPYIAADAAAYLDQTFKDISDAGVDTVFLANWHGKPGIYDVTLEKAAEYGLKMIGLPDGHGLFKFWGGNYFDSEALYSNDEVQMHSALVELTNKALDSEHAEQLIGYLLFDEPRSLYVVDKERFRDNLSVMRRMLESIDPGRFTVIDYTMPEDAAYFYPSNQTQAMSLDLYPVVNHYPTPGNFKHIGTYPNATYEESLDASTLQIRKELTNDAPVWMILQAHGEVGGLPREPIPSEIRAMTYEAIGRGARGFTYFLYQSTVVWRGMVDYDYTHRPHIYGTIKQLMSEIDALKPTILDMRRIANIAATTGGGGGATTQPFDPGYPSADITTHESVSTPNKYMVVVNHNAEVDDDVTITIDRAKLGMNVKSILEVSKTDGSKSEVEFQTTLDSYIISDVNFAAGDGKIFELVRDDEQIVKEVQDSLFGTWGAGSTRGNADLSASDGKTAMKVIGDSNGPMDFYSYTHDAELTVGQTYDVYAKVKVNYKTALLADLVNGPSFPKPEGDAFTVGLNFSAGGNILDPTVIPAGSMENMFWTDLKVGRFTATADNIAQQASYVYVSPANNKANIESIYVDKFYFVEAGEPVSSEPGAQPPVTNENGKVENSSKVSVSPQKLKELFAAAKPDENGILNIVLDYTKNKVVNEVRINFTDVNEWLSKREERANLVVMTDFGTVKVNGASIRKLSTSSTGQMTLVIRKGSFIIEGLVNDRPVDWTDEEHPLEVEVNREIKPGENGDYIVAYRESGGVKTILPQSVYANGKAAFRSAQSGTFDVLYNEKSFMDMKGHWSDKAVKYMAARDVIKGTGNNAFLPDATVTRADFVAMLVRMLGLKGTGTESFSDVSSGDYYAKEVATAKALQLIKGNGKNEFKPKEQITRQEMFTIAERALRKLEMLNDEPGDADLSRFKDANAISGYARDSISALYAKGLVNGSQGKLNPANPATRAEAAQFLMNVLLEISIRD
ncbi:S-layer homology domain-containing protein [Paenibacillus agaridevorans]|uniref:S-layer homology domain-containing protein n=1 Tax=Paenibacillus agaridevorans TaxID=171404 RepID=UPI001BE41DC4|nr:S-layer homology domain-containing protein [Paenibacillus agaridevorans]